MKILYFHSDLNALLADILANIKAFISVAQCVYYTLKDHY